MMMSNPTVIEMVIQALMDGGYDGLFSVDGECSCEMDDLEPCGEIGSECMAGYKTEVCPVECKEGADFYIVRDKPEPVCTSCGEPGYCSCCAADDERKRRKEEPGT